MCGCVGGKLSVGLAEGTAGVLGVVGVVGAMGCGVGEGTGLSVGDTVCRAVGTGDGMP